MFNKKYYLPEAFTCDKPFDSFHEPDFQRMATIPTQQSGVAQAPFNLTISVCDLTAYTHLQSNFATTSYPESELGIVSSQGILPPESKLIGKIRSFRVYKDGWCGPGSKAPSIGALDNAEAFVRSLKWDWQNIRIPHVSVASDGEVCFWWKLPDSLGVIDFGFDFNGLASYYACFNGKESMKDDIPIEKLLGEDDFLDILRKYVHI